MPVVKTASLIDGACFISDFIVGHPFEGVVRFTSMAAQVFGFTRDNDLRRDVDVRPLSIPGNLDSVREGRGGCVSPARTAILGHMLVSHICDPVRVLVIIPEHLSGQIINRLQRFGDPRRSSILASSMAREVGVNVLGPLGESNSGDQCANGKCFHGLLFVQLSLKEIRYF